MPMPTMLASMLAKLKKITLFNFTLIVNEKLPCYIESISQRYDLVKQEK